MTVIDSTAKAMYHRFIPWWNNRGGPGDWEGLPEERRELYRDITRVTIRAFFEAVMNEKAS